MNRKPKNVNIEKTDVLIFMTVIIIFTISLLSFFPGLLTSDTVDQIGQANANSYKDAHPIFHSFLIGNLAKLGGIWVPELFQIIVFALIWSFICKRIRKYNNSTKNKLFQVLITFIICIIPLNFIYSIIIWKDILYSYAMLALTGFIYIGIKEKFKFTNLEIIAMSISLASIMKFRHNGVPIGLLMFLIIITSNVIYNKSKKQFIMLLSSFIIALILMTIPKWIWGQKSKDNMVGGALDSTKVYCMGALLNSDINLESDEIEFLNTIYNIEKWKTNFDPYNGTIILFDKSYNSKILQTEEGKQKFNSIFVKYAKQKPKIVIKHFMNVNSIWWSIEEKGPMHSIILSNGYLSEMTNGIYDNRPILNKMNEKLVNYSVKTLENKFIYNLLYRPATAILISSIAIIAVCIKKKNIWYLILLFPMSLNIGTYILLISSQDQRYFYPCFMTEYIALLIFAETFISKKMQDNKKSNRNNKKDPKTLVIIPAYNEEKNIEKVVSDINENSKYDYIIINDSSKDETLAVCKNNDFNYLSLPVNYGLSSGIQLGMKYALENNYDIAIQFDGDGQHQAIYLKDLVNEITNNNCDIVIGSRFVTKEKPKSLRMLGSNIISICIKLVTGQKIKDPTSGMRAYNKDVIEEFVKDPSLTPEPDTLTYMIKRGKKIKEVQVEMRERLFGESYLRPIKAAEYMLNMVAAIIFFRNFQD